MSVPRIAVVGRQNVGKSTLVNRLFGKRETIAHDDPGVTRDRIELEAVWNGRRFGLVDTAGYLHRATGVEALAGRQAVRAMEEAQVILLVVDVASGITEEDAQLARRLRRATSPVVVVVNKVDAARDEAEVPAFLALGLGDPLPVSSKHGRGVGELLDRLVDLLPDTSSASTEAEDAATDDEPRFAIVGRPNVGKSSLFNRLVGEERSVVFEEAGTTRDSVDALVEWPGAGRVRFVDTAGMRRAIRVKGIEYYSFVRAGEAIDRAHAAAVVFDASEGFTAEDQKIAFRVLEAGRALLLVANKWDLVDDKDRLFKRLTEEATMFARATVDPDVRGAWSRGRQDPGPARRAAYAVDGTGIHVAGQPGRPGAAALATAPPIGRHSPLRRPGGDPAAFVRLLRGRAPTTLPRIGATSRTGCVRRSTWKGFRSGCGSGRAPAAGEDGG